MKKKLLIVDDEPEITASLMIYFEDDGYEIFTASNGKEALEVFHKRSVDCVLSDIQMPIMSGLDLIKEIRKENTTIPFIFFTGHDDRVNMQHAFKYGAFDFIQKPQFENLSKIVQAAFDSLSTDKTATKDSVVLKKFKEII